MRQCAFLFSFFVLVIMSGAMVARAAESVPPSLTADEEKELIMKVKAGWHARTGETAEQVIAATAKVAHFTPRDWYGWVSRDGTERGVGLSWVKHKTDKDDDAYNIQWTVKRDGSTEVGPPYAKPMELGSAAFAISLIQDEVNDKERSPNVRYLRDVRNLNFVETQQGKLGDLLVSGRCSLRDPTYVEYGPLSRSNDRKGFQLQLSVNCRIAGPTYFTKDGVILFKTEDGETAWRPFSFFALRLTKYPPGSWFAATDPTEQAAMALVAAQALRSGMNAADAIAMLKVVELRNDGDMVHY